MPPTMPNMPDEQDQQGPGFLTRAASNPWIALPYIFGTGVAAAAHPALARGVGAINHGVEFGIGLEEKRRKDLKEQRLSEALNRAFDATSDRTTYQPQIETEPGDYPIGDRPVTEKVPLFSPAIQNYGKALIQGGDTKSATDLINKVLVKDESVNPLMRGRPGDVFYNRVTQQPEYTVPTEKQTYTTSVNLGGSTVIETRDRRTGGVIDRRVEPNSPAPVRPLSPEDSTLKDAQTDLARARATRERALTKRVDALTRSPRGGTAFNEWLAQGNDAQDAEGFLNYFAERQNIARGGDTETERERIMSPLDQSVARSAIAKAAAEAGLNKLPYAESRRRWKQLAEDFGMEIDGIPDIKYEKGEGDWFYGSVPVLSGKFSLRPKSVKTTTQRGVKSRSASSQNNDPLGIR